jgi:hypothetical protein
LFLQIKLQLFDLLKGKERKIKFNTNERTNCKNNLNN